MQDAVPVSQEPVTQYFDELQTWSDTFFLDFKSGHPHGKAFGRSLADFIQEQAHTIGLKTYTFKLLPAELRLLRAIVTGHSCRLSVERPDAPSAEQQAAGDDPQIRAGFLRFLALGGDDNVPVQEAGLEIYGAYIVGDVDLCRGNCVKKLVLNETHIDGSLQIEDASLGILALQKSYVSGIVGRRSKIDGTLLLDGIQCVGEISLYRAKIGGNVQCSGANLKRNANNFTVLNCYHATIGGDVLLNDGFTAQGGISLQNASIEGCIYCTGGVFNADGDKDKEGNIYTGTALDCSNASIRGDVLLIARGSERFKAKGMVSFHSATIGGKFDCTGGSFDGTTHFCASESKIGTALDCQNTSIKREVVLGDSSSKQGNSVSGGRFEALGTVTFCGANLVAGLNCIGGLFDGATSTGKHLKQFGTSLDCTNSTIKQGAYLGALSSGECFESRVRLVFMEQILMVNYTVQAAPFRDSGVSARRTEIATQENRIIRCDART